MSDLFKFTEYAKQVSMELESNDDKIICSAMSSKLIVIYTQALATAKGMVHLLNPVVKEASVIGPYPKIIDINCEGSVVAVGFSEGIVAFDAAIDSELLRFYGNDVRRVALCGIQSTGSTTVSYASEDTIYILQKGWVRVSSNPLIKNVIQADVLNSYLMYLYSIHQVGITLYNLQSMYVFQRHPRDNAAVLDLKFLSLTRYMVMSDLTVTIYEIFKEGIFERSKPAAKISLDYMPESWITYNQKYMVVLDPNYFIHINSLENEEIYSEKVNLKGKIIHDGLNNTPFYIVSDSRILKISPYTAQERLAWLQENGKIEEAYEFAKMNSLTTQDLETSIMNRLIEKKDWSKAIDTCIEICQKNFEAWKHWVYEFSNVGELKQIIKYVPLEIITGMDASSLFIEIVNEGELDTVMYLLDHWPSHFWNSYKVPVALTVKNFGHALAKFYENTGQITNALNFYITHHDPHCFKLLLQNPDHFKILKEDPGLLPHLFETDSDLARDVVLSQRRELPPRLVVANLKPHHALHYIIELEYREPNASIEFEAEMLDLIIVENPSYVTEFISKCKSLDLEDALNKCLKYNLNEATVAILLKLGRKTEAEDILKRDFDTAVPYLKQHVSSDLWEAVIQKGLEKPETTRKLLKLLHYYKNPGAIISKLDIDKYRSEVMELVISISQLVKITHYAHRATIRDILDFNRSLVQALQEQILVQPPFICSVCAQPLKDRVIIRRCGHHSHSGCGDVCNFCSYKNISIKLFELD
jgi:hypothetical protein